MNKVILIGRLGENPEELATDKATMTRFSLATEETYKKDGEKHSITEWHKIVAFNKIAEIIIEHCKKGNLVAIEGKLKTRKYQKNDEDHYITEVIVEKIKFLATASND